MKTFPLSCLLAGSFIAPALVIAQSRTNQCETVIEFATGMSASGNPLRAGATDPRFKGITANFPDRGSAVVVSNVPATWFRGINVDSQWIAPEADPAGSAAGVYAYQLTFAMPCAGARVTGRFAAADRAVILLNGIATGIATPATGYTNWTTVALSNLLAGTNIIDFVVTNVAPPVAPPGPTGLRAELTATATCCPCIVLNCSPDIVVQTCNRSVPVAFAVTGTNRCFTNLAVVCTPPSGSSFAQGIHFVSCTASDTAGHSTNCSFVVRVEGYPPVIQQQPQGTLAMSEGGTHLLQVIASDAGNCGGLGYQWLRDGSIVAGAASSSLLLNPLTISRSGGYAAIVSNMFGVVTSEVAVVRVLQGRDPHGTLQRFSGTELWQFAPTPGGRVFSEGDLINLRVQASSNLLQWVTLPGALSVDNGTLKITDPFAVLYAHRFYRMISGDVPLVPGRPDTSTTEVPLSNLSTQTLALAQRHVEGFIASRSESDDDPGAWANVTFAPTARYLYDPGYQNGAAPAYAELRVLGPKGPGDARGYLIVSLTEEDFPIIEFATSGETKTDRVLRESPGGVVHKFMRFSPVYIVGEDAAGKRLGAFGTEPLKVLDPLPSTGGVQVASYDSATGVSVIPPRSDINLVTPLDYDDLKAEFQAGAARLQFRALRNRQAAARWRLAKGIRNPTLHLGVGQKASFVTGQMLASAIVQSDEEPAVQIQVLAGGGFAGTGLRPGDELVRVQDQAGAVEYYTMVITAAAGLKTSSQLAAEKSGASRAKGDCPDWDTDVWTAGTGWNGDQRQFQQLSRDRWCPKTGCGPVALAMLFGWWDVNGVPSAFYQLKSGKGDKDDFRFDFDSLHDSDAPKDLSDDDDENHVVPVYDDIHGLCNVFCAVDGSGATHPDQLASAFEEYIRRVADPWPSPEDEFGQGFVSGNMHASWVPPASGQTDWEGGGTLVANGIKAGHPGIVGIGSVLWDLHYPLAYAYKRMKEFEGCGSDRELVDTHRFFKCNMGWGPNAAPEWHNAEDVWFGLTADLWQSSNPFKPVDHVPADPQLAVNKKVDLRRPAAAAAASPGRVYFVEVPNRSAPGAFDRVRSQNNGSTWTTTYNPAFGGGLFSSSAAVAVSSNGLKLHVFGRGLDDRIWRAYSANGGTSWNTAWVKFSGDRVFKSAPAAVISADGEKIHVFGLGSNNRYYRTFSLNGGATWYPLWRQPIEDGGFKSAPAATMSADGHRLYLIGLGDSGVWAARSVNGGTNWVGWTRIITDSTPSSAPALVGDATGQYLHVIVRRPGDKFWISSSSTFGADWSAWSAIGGGLFTSSPGAAISANGQRIHVFGRGLAQPPPPPGNFSDPADPRIWGAYSPDGGETWQGWWEIVPSPETPVE